MRKTFFRRMNTYWRTTGAMCPSSVRLARELASLASGCDRVLELGAGSGAVTLALSAVVNKEKLHAVELQETLVESLREKFPTLNVSQGAADAALDSYQPAGAVAIVSSLPFRSLAPAIKHKTVESLLRFLNASPDSRLIQYTYGLGTPFPVPSEFEWRQVKWVFVNFPPACIWVLTKIADRQVHDWHAAPVSRLHGEPGAPAVHGPGVPTN